jgi:hypothetical protein
MNLNIENNKLNNLKKIFIGKVLDYKNTPIPSPVQMIYGKSIISLITWLLLIYIISIIILF